MQIATTIAIVLLHSIWQSGLLLAVYFFLNKVVIVNPVSRRNMLLTLLATQFFLSISTFLLLWLKPESNFPNTLIFDSINTPGWIHSSYVYLLMIYCAIVLIKISSYLFEWKRLNSIQQLGLIKPSLDIRLFTLSRAVELGVKKVDIWLSEHIQTPFTYGFIKPVILLPVALVNNLSLEETETLIIHELSHIQNNDYLLNLFIIFSDSIFFFNPFTHLIIRFIKLEREKSCDIQVLNYAYPAEMYAGTLLKAARSVVRPEALAMGAISGKDDLLKRILFFTKEINQITMKKRFNPVSYALLLFVAFFTLFCFTGQKKATPELAYTPIMLPGYQYEISAGATTGNKKIAPFINFASVQCLSKQKFSLA